MKNLVSIVLPIYNGEKYMRESIESVINQTYTNWELLILDDCSVDNTAKIAREYVSRDQRIKYFKNDKNLKLPRNLNKGFSLSNGEYLTWTSDDNKFRSTAIEKMINTLKVEGTEFVFASCRIIDGDGREIEYIMVNESSRKRIVGNNPVGACFMYTRKVYETIGDYNPDLVLVEDFDYWQRICAKFSFSIIEDILYDYRWHDGALTSTMNQVRFCENLEKTLLVNASKFGKMDLLQKYYYFQGLSNCRAKIGRENPYKAKFNLYKALYWISYKIPNKLKRILKNDLFI